MNVVFQVNCFIDSPKLASLALTLSTRREGERPLADVG